MAGGLSAGLKPRPFRPGVEEQPTTRRSLMDSRLRYQRNPKVMGTMLTVPVPKLLGVLCGESTQT